MVLAFKLENVPAVPSTKTVIFEMKIVLNDKLHVFSTFVQNPLIKVSSQSRKLEFNVFSIVHLNSNSF